MSQGCIRAYASTRFFCKNQVQQLLDIDGALHMTYDDFNCFCESLPATNYVMQWGGSHVWKVGAKVFAIGGWADADANPAFTFKVEPMAFAVLCDQPGLRPAPYFASRGMKWIQCYAKPRPSDAQLKELLQDSHRIVARGLTKKARKDLGLD